MTIHQLRPEDAVDPRLEQFNKFWENYPLKKGKADARRLFMKIIQPGGCDVKIANKDGGVVIGMEETHLEATAEEIIEGAKRFIDTFPIKGGGGADHYKRDTTFCPHATTWMHHSRWED